MTLILKEASTDDKDDVLAMLHEIGPGENGFINLCHDMHPTEFPDYLQRKIDNSQGLRMREGHVPQTTYWLFEDGHPVGMSKLRHWLNDALRRHGGHIGYCIRPSERGRGLGNQLLKFTLQKAKEMGIDKVQLDCAEDNIPSRCLIEWNGGVLVKKSEGACYYHIEIE